MADIRTADRAKKFNFGRHVRPGPAV